MHEFFSRDPDPLDAMLRPPSLPDSGTMRQALYDQTRRVLHRRRRVRQFAYAASLLLSFALGAGAMRMAAPTDSDQRADIGTVETQRNQGADTPRSPAPDESALDAEWIAFDSTDRRGELYRRAGDRYKDENDLQSALRCYGNALDSGTEQDLDISPNDDWLLMAIKNARQKENNRAKQGG